MVNLCKAQLDALRIKYQLVNLCYLNPVFFEMLTIQYHKSLAELEIKTTYAFKYYDQFGLRQRNQLRVVVMCLMTHILSKRNPIIVWSAERKRI